MRSALFMMTISLAASACVRRTPPAPYDLERTDWPTRVSPSSLPLKGGPFQAATIAIEDFISLIDLEEDAPPHYKCLESKASYIYRITHDEAKHQYFVRLSPSDGCAMDVMDMGAEYAIDDRTWTIQGRRTGASVPPLFAPLLALLEIRDCPTCPSGSATFPFNYGVIATPQDHTFYVLNVGEEEASAVGDGGLAGGLTFKGGAYPGVGGTCDSIIAGGEICTVVVTYTPNFEEETISAVSLTYHDGATRRTVSRAVRGTGTTGAHLVILDNPDTGRGDALPPADFDYGTAGIPRDHKFYVINTGGETAVGLGDAGGLTEHFTFKSGAYPGEGGTCGASLAKSERCTVVVTFTPSGSGFRLGTLSLTYNTGSAKETATRILKGAATPRALLSISDFSPADDCAERCDPYDFGTVAVGTEALHSFTIINRGAVAITSLAEARGVVQPFSYLDSGRPDFASTCGNIPPGGSCAVSVRFSPTSPGAFVSSIVLDYEDGLGQTLRTRRALRGTAR